MDYKLLGRKIRERRTHKHISQEKLAEMVDISVTYMGAIENARKHPSLTTLVNIANALGTTPDFFLGGNLWHDVSLSQNELGELIQDCTPYERHIIISLVKSLKCSMREYRLVQNECLR